MISIEWIGTAGIVAIEGSYVPQITRLFWIKRADELSVFFPSLNLLGRLLAMAYSVVAKDQVFAIGFFVGALLRLTLLLQVVWYRRLAARGKSTLPAIAGAQESAAR